MEQEQTTLLTLIIVSLILSVLSIATIIRKAFKTFLPFIHITCLVGSLIILALSILDLLRALKMLDLSSSIYFLSASLTSILSSYILLQVGFNFYQDYNFIKTLLMFAPIVVSMGVFGLSVFIAIRMI